MPFVTKIKWVVLSVITLSVASIIIHLSLAKLWTVNIVPYRAIASFPGDFSPGLGRQVVKNKKLWGSIKSLEALQPSSNARSNYTDPKERSNGFIYAKVFGGFEKIRSSICDLVAISRLLNATLIIPEIQESIRSKGISSRFKSFSYLYDEDQFITYLKHDVIIAKTLPESLMERRKRNEFPTFRPTSSASPNFYIQELLPKLKKSKVIGLIISNGGALQSVLPPTMAEIQRLRCRVSFQALQFRSEIQMLGHRMVNKLRSLGQPFLAYHPGLLRESLAYNGCAELFQDVHTELIQHRRAQMIKDKILNEDLNFGIATTNVNSASGFRSRPKFNQRKSTIVCIGWDPEGILAPPSGGHIARQRFRKSIEKDSDAREAFERQVREEKERLQALRESREVPDTPKKLIEYFLDTETQNFEFEIARMRPRLNEEFFSEIKSELGEIRFAVNKTPAMEDRLVELETLEKAIREGKEAYDKMQDDLTKAKENLTKILTSKDVKATLLDMVERNEINRTLLTLLDENISSAHGANQTQAAQFMEKLRGAVLKYITV